MIAVSKVCVRSFGIRSFDLSGLGLQFAFVMSGSPDQYISVAAHLVNELALPDRLQSFRRSAS